MTIARHAKRRDANEDEIVRALEAAGCVVHRLDRPCDLLVGRAGRWVLLEVKRQGFKSRDVMPVQRQALDAARAGLTGPVHLVTCVGDALRAMEETR